MQQETGDYPAAASHQQVLALFSDRGNRLGNAEAQNRLVMSALRAAGGAVVCAQICIICAIARPGRPRSARTSGLEMAYAP